MWFGPDGLDRNGVGVLLLIQLFEYILQCLTGILYLLELPLNRSAHVL